MALANADTVDAVPSSVSFEPLPEPGDQIGRYTVVDKVGAGGMGVVYRARDPSLQRAVAIKLVRPGKLRGHGADQHRARLLREARALAQLQHQNVIQIYDVGEHGSAVFFAMEFVQGKDAEAWLADESPPWPRILGVFRAAGRGLSAAHSANLVHRDFKPANILVGDDQRVRVLDFGLARDAGDLLGGRPARGASAHADRDLRGVTTPGIVVGTPAYMAPEQLAGLPADARSDQYSFCLSLWEALFDVLPFEGADARSMAEAKARDALQPPPPDTDVPAALVALLRRGLASNPAKRFASMRELLRGLRRVADAHASSEASTGATRPQTGSSGRGILPWAAFGLATAAAAVLAWRTPDPHRCADDPRATQLRASYRAQVDRGDGDGARRVAVELASHWTDRGCPARAEDWAALGALDPRR